MFIKAALSLGLLTLPQVLAAPQPAYGPPAYGAPNFCINNAKVVALLKACTTGAPYCNSYLHVSTKTVTKTSNITPTPTTTTTTVTAKAKTTTVPTTVATAYPTSYTAGTTIVTIYLDLPAPTYTVNTTETLSPTTVIEFTTVTPPPITETSTTTASCASAAASGNVLTRRAYPTTTIQKPAAIPKTWNASQISAGCSCMSNPVPSTTTTTTKTLAPKTCTTKVTTTPTVTKYSTVYSTSYTPVGTSTIVTSTTTITGFISDPFTTTVTFTEQSTVTETRTTEVAPSTVTVTETALVNNGFTYSLYSNYVDENPGPRQYPSDQLKSLSSSNTGSATSVNFGTDFNWYITLSDGFTFYSPAQALVMHAYLSIKVTGTYTITIPGDRVDNWMTIWLGDSAYTWTEASAAAFGNYPGGGGVTTQTYTAGDIVPVTFLWANSNGPATSLFQISGPDGASDDINSYLTQPCANSPFTNTN